MKETDTYKELNPKALYQWIDEKRNFTLIDTLKSDSFTRRHLKNAVNACVFEVTFVDQVNAITDDMNSVIVLYGASKRSFDAVTAAEKLTQNGYTDIYILFSFSVLDCLGNNLKKLIIHISLGHLNRFTQDNKTDLNQLFTEFFIFWNLGDGILNYLCCEWK